MGGRGSQGLGWPGACVDARHPLSVRFTRAMKSLLSLVTLALAASTAFGAQDALEPRVRALEGELSRLWMRFESPTAIESVGAGEFQELAQAELERLHGPGWFETHAFVRQALGMDRNPSLAAVRAAVARAELGAFPVLYRSDTHALVIDDSRRGETSDADLVRALAVASRDRSGGLAALLGEKRTCESVHVRRALLAGEGELAVLAFAEKSAGRDPRKLQSDDLDEPLKAGKTDVLERELHRVGRDHALRRLRDFDLEGVRNQQDEAPASTEQLLHATKLYKDRPRALELPQWPAELGLELVRDDSLGELGLYALLVESGMEPVPARIATLGWDGDRVQFWRDPAGKLALVARLSFDRVEDTAQFTRELQARALGTIIPRGFAVDWVRSENVALVDALVIGLNALKPGLKANREDQDSTILIEKDLESLVDLRPRVESGRWVLPRFQLSMPVPEGWLTDTLGGQPFLVGPQIERFKDNIGVVALDAERGTTLDAWLERQRNILSNQKELVLDTAERRTLGNRDFAYLRYHGKVEANELDCTTLAYILDGRPVAVTMSIAKDNVEWLRPRVEKCLLELKVAPVRPAAVK